MVHVVKGIHKMKLPCEFCGVKTNEWTKQHIEGIAKPFCVECHTDFNYYLAPCEEKALTWETLETARPIILDRKRSYGDVPLPKKVIKRERQERMNGKFKFYGVCRECNGINSFGSVQSPESLSATYDFFAKIRNCIFCGSRLYAEAMWNE